MTSNSLLDEAVRLTQSGLSVIPILRNGSKAPAVPTWKEFQERIATDEELHAWFRKEVGLAIVTGKVSGDLEVLNFDEGDLFDPWSALLRGQSGPELVNKLPVVFTPSEGWHVYYRCPESIERNQKLAQRRGTDGRPEVLIETRGEGGYVLAPNSPVECHPSRRPYFLVQGDLADIPTITAEERSVLLDVSRSFNEVPAVIVRGPSSGTGHRPGDDFNARASWEEILLPAGWAEINQRGEVTLWRRPGKSHGISATTKFGGTNYLYNFSTNGHPFEACKAYTKFSAYTFLNHDGDFSAAAADLRAKGYGSDESSFASFANFAFAEPPKGLEEEAFYGLAGDFVKTVGPHTESDPAALLIQFLVSFGNIVEREAHFHIEADDHHTNLFTVIVGRTSKARKGTSWGHVRSLFREIDEDWGSNRIQSGLSRGEGLIWNVRDSDDEHQ